MYKITRYAAAVTWTEKDFDQNLYLQAAPVVHRSRVSRGVRTVVKDTGRRLPANARVNRAETFNLVLRTENVQEPALRGTKYMYLVCITPLYVLRG